MLDSTIFELLMSTSIFLVLGALPNAVIFILGSGPIEETNKLLKFLEKDHISEEGMVLADIYNIDVEVHRPTNKKSKLGF